MIFANTSGLYELVVGRGDRADRSLKWVADDNPDLVTTDYVLAELLNLINARLGGYAAREASRMFRRR